MYLPFEAHRPDFWQVNQIDRYPSHALFFWSFLFPGALGLILCHLIHAWSGNL